MTDAVSPQWIIVDDTDTSIQYSGPWFADSSGSRDKFGNYGPAYESTLHGTTLNASLAYNFNGTRVIVLGSNNLRNDSGVLDPTWECFVDDISIGVSKPFAYAENNWEFCGYDTLVDGPHVLTVNATVLKSQTFWFDSIQYVPSATVSLDNKTILIDNLDPQLKPAYGSGWEALGGSVNMTTQTNSVFTFNFTGISLSWYGYIPAELPHTATTATYSVDGNTPVKFQLQGLPPSWDTIYYQKFFETTQLAQGNHQIVVVFQGNGQTTPLTLDFLLIQNGTTPESTASSATPSNPLIQHEGKNDTGIIAGGIVGAIALIILAILGYLYIRRCKKQISLDEKEKNSSDLITQPSLCSNVPTKTSILYDSATEINKQGSATWTNARGYGHNKISSFSTTYTTQSVELSSTFPSNASSLGHQSKSSIFTQREIPTSDARLTSSAFVKHQDSGIRLPLTMTAKAVKEIPLL